MLGVALILFAVALRPSPARAGIRIETQNPATAEALSLATLPGSGLPLARRTVLFRDQIAPLDPPDRMRGIPGLGTRRLHEWSRWIEIP